MSAALIPANLAESLREDDLPVEFVERAAPEIASEEVPACPVCRKASHHAFASGYDYELLTCRNAWCFVRCDGCAHVWLNPRPAVSTLSVIYPSSYYAYNYEAAINPIAVHGKRFLDGLKVQGILKQMARLPKRYLDIGCGSGRFLKALEQKGLAREDLRIHILRDPRSGDLLRGSAFDECYDRRERNQHHASIAAHDDL